MQGETGVCHQLGPGVAWHGWAWHIEGRKAIQQPGRETTMLQIQFTITGRTPLIFHNARLCDPEDVFTAALARWTELKIAKKRDNHAISLIEWCGGMYHNDDCGDLTFEYTTIKEQSESTEKKKSRSKGVKIESEPFITNVVWPSDAKAIIPQHVIMACLVDGAKDDKKGLATRRYAFIPQPACLVYDGPSDLNKLMNDRRFVLRKSVRIGRNRVMRTRPFFQDWQASFMVEFDDCDQTEIKADDIRVALATAGRTRGMGDWRPEHGRFVIDDYSCDEVKP